MKMNYLRIRTWLPLAILALAILPVLNMKAQERLPPIPPDKMTDAQKKVAAEYKAIHKNDLNGGPYAVFLRLPDTVIPAVELRMHNLNNSALDHKLTEFAILIAARHWTSNYVWNAHGGAASKAGLSADTMAALADGRRPERMSEDEQIVYEFCTELLQNKSVSDVTYDRMLAKFGEPGVVEAASLEGYYGMLCMVMNTARTALPPGAKPQLAPFPKN
jgi:4-carboxymuconolactone decarboxylase